MTKTRRKRKSARSKSSPLTSPLVLAGLAVLAVAIAFEVKTRPRTASSPAVTPQALGAPRLVVDRTEIDEGTVPLNVSVTSEFQLTNAGDVPLEILEDPDVEVVEGC